MKEGDLMKEKVIYDNGCSKLTARFDGEILGLRQEIENIDVNEISLYANEFEEIIKFIKENVQLKMEELKNGFKRYDSPRVVAEEFVSKFGK